MAKYQKNPTVVVAFQAVNPADYGVLGNLISTDWILDLASGDLHSMSNATFITKYSLASDTATVTGIDWD
jgi:hypothetical protein